MWGRKERESSKKKKLEGFDGEKTSLNLGESRKALQPSAGDPMGSIGAEYGPGN